MSSLLGANIAGETIEEWGKKNLWKLFLFSLKIKGIKCEVIYPHNKCLKTVFQLCWNINSLASEPVICLKIRKEDSWTIICFQSVQSLSRVWLFYPCTSAHRASLSFTISHSLLKFIFIEWVMPSNHLILCHPLLPPPGLSKWVSSSHQVAEAGYKQ